jgi:hypothetical protein
LDGGDLPEPDWVRAEMFGLLRTAAGADPFEIAHDAGAFNWRFSSFAAMA